MAYRLGKKKEQNRENRCEMDFASSREADEDRQKAARTNLFIVNIITIIVSIAVISGKLTAVFMIAFSFSLIVNYPKVSDQKERIDAHAKRL